MVQPKESDKGNTGDYSGLLEAALEISKRRADVMRQMREALLRGDEAEALVYARVLCGLEPEK